MYLTFFSKDIVVQVGKVMPSFDFAIHIPSASQVLFGTFSSSCRLSFFPYFLILSYDYSGVFFFLLSPFCVPMHRVSCAGYTPRAWDPRSLYTIFCYLLPYTGRITHTGYPAHGNSKGEARGKSRHENNARE